MDKSDNIDLGLREAALKVMEEKGITDINLAYPHVAMQNVRKGKKTFKWHIIPLLALVVFVYSIIIRESNWYLLFCALGYWSAEFIWEQFNALVFHFTKKAPLWTTPGHNSAYTIYVGLNLEICFMFGIASAACGLILPANHMDKFLGIPLNVWLPFGLGLMGVIVEMMLNKVDALTWYWKFWNLKMPIPCMCVYCGTFIAVTQVYVHTQAAGNLLIPGILFGTLATIALTLHIVLTKKKII